VKRENSKGSDQHCRSVSRGHAIRVVMSGRGLGLLIAHRRKRSWRAPKDDDRSIVFHGRNFKSPASSASLF